MSKKSITLAAVTLTVVSFALATAASAKPIFQPVGPSLQPINGGSMYKPVNPGLKPINSGSICKPVDPSLKPFGKKPGGCPNGWVVS